MLCQNSMTPRYHCNYASKTENKRITPVSCNARALVTAYVNHQVAFDALLLLLNKNPKTQYSTMTSPTIMPANFKIATLFPCCAIRPSLDALVLIDVCILEKASFYAYREVSQGTSNRKTRTGEDSS